MLLTNLNIELTTRCQLSCLFCEREILMKQGKRAVGDISWELVEKIVEQYAVIAKRAKYNIRWSAAGLGDPLLYPRFFDVVSLIKEKIPDVHTRVNTNILALNAAMIDGLLSSDLDTLIMSLNFWDSRDYANLCRCDVFEKAKINIENLLKRRKVGKPKIILQLMDIPLNEAKRKDFSAYWKKLGADEILFRFFIPLAYSVYLDMSEEEADVYCEFFRQEDKKLDQPRHPCSALWDFCCVSKDGNIFPCCYGLRQPESDINLGNVNEVRILDAYEKGIGRLRDLHRQRKWDTIDACRDCTYWTAM